MVVVACVVNRFDPYREWAGVPDLRFADHPEVIVGSRSTAVSIVHGP